MRLSLPSYAAISALALGAAVVNAYVHKKQFYTACVYLSRSNLSMMVREILLRRVPSHTPIEKGKEKKGSSGWNICQKTYHQMEMVI